LLLDCTDSEQTQEGESMRPLILVLLFTLAAGNAWALKSPVLIDQGRPQAAARVQAAPAADPNDAVLAYDSGPTYFFPDATAIGTLWGVRFTPAQACSLMNVQVHAFQGGGQVMFRFFADSSGQPGAEFGTPQVRTLVGDLNLETVTLDPVDMGTADFYLIMEVMSGPPPYPVTDADGGTGRSWYRFPGQDWEHVVDFDINIRAGVRYYGADIAGPEVVHIPVTRGFSEEFSTEIRCGLNDFSGIDRALVFYRVVGSPTFDSSSMTFQVENIWQAELPPFAAGTAVEYFIRAYDASPSGNLGTLPLGAPAVSFSFTMHPGVEIAYDDGSPEIYFFIDTVWQENTFAVRMTPPRYPMQINLLRAFVNDTSVFDFEIHAAAGDSLAGLLAGPFEARAIEPFSWADFDVPEVAAPTITSGDFFVLFKWKSDSPTLPAVGADSVPTSASRSYSYDNTFGWFKYPMFDWLIRAAAVTPTGITELGGPELPRNFELAQNYPNPFNPQTNIEFALSEGSHVTLTVFNLLGQDVRTLVSESLPAGTYRADFDARDNKGQPLPSGLYFYRLDTGEYSQTRKMMLLR
jgi:hypothetical protein